MVQALGILALLLASFSCQTGKSALAHYTYLSDLKPETAAVEWFGYVADIIPKDTPLILRDVVYKKGILTHGPARVVYKLDKNYKRFSSTIGLWDSGHETSRKIVDFAGEDWRSGEGSVRYIVKLDGKPAFTSKVITWANDDTISIDVRNATSLELIIDVVDTNSSDWAVWADAKLLDK
jgi:hypothetical protein